MVFKGFSIYLRDCITLFRHPCIQMVLDIWNGLYGQVTTVHLSQDFVLPMWC